MREPIKLKDAATAINRCRYGRKAGLSTGSVRFPEQVGQSKQAELASVTLVITPNKIRIKARIAVTSSKLRKMGLKVLFTV